MIQLILTYIVVAAAFTKVGVAVYKSVKKDGASGCSSGCGGCGSARVKKDFAKKHNIKPLRIG